MGVDKQPVSYLQTDTRWKDIRLKCTGGTMSIGGGGCGPTSAAMLIETLTGKTCLPTETMKWVCDKGYMIANQGTSYDAFKPLFAAYGIACEMNAKTCLSATSPVRTEVIKNLNAGFYYIALMKKGLWTNGGHYVVVWWADDKIRINDPASTKAERLNGDPDTFFSQAKYFWAVDARKFNKNGQIVADTSAAVAVSTAKIDVPVLKKGVKHPSVKTLQALLKAIGYSCTVNGVFGVRTEAALKKYQAAQKLTVDAVCGPATWKRLLGWIDEVLQAE